VECLTDGGNTWIHAAVIAGRPVVDKTLNPECQDVALAIHEIEGELDIHSKLVHKHICGFVRAGCTNRAGEAGLGHADSDAWVRYEDSG